MKFIFFGSSQFSTAVLDTLAGQEIFPAVVITTPDRPKGRGLKLTPTPVKVWAKEHGIPVITREKLDRGFNQQLILYNPQLAVVASYGKIIPRVVFELPTRGTLNIHPSLLPRYRGASPIESMILADDKDSVGVSIILIDEKVDHGPVMAQEKVMVKDWPPAAPQLEQILGAAGGRLLAKILPDFLSGKLKPIAQDESKATFTKKLIKEDGVIDLKNNPRKNLLKIKALEGWPGTHFFVTKNGRKIRVLIKKVSFKSGELAIERVVPEGKKEVEYKEFLRGLR